ncbi:MAG TPA: GNAT family N-acetyltransferase [Acidimicrobiales bacterium]|nr:GNAT family N-acetyltransferase [Acidimicrobiales bacterium]
MTAALAVPPAHWHSDVVLADGGTVHVRPIQPTDAPGLIAFHSRLSAEAVYHRFFAYKPALSEEEARWFTTVDHVDRVAFVAELRDELLAVARYDRLPESPHDAEVAFVVGDRHQGRGIGTVLLEHLAAAAREHGITRFVAETLADNARMLEVFRRAGFDERTHMADGVVTVELTIEPTDRTFAAIEEREHRAEALSVARLLTPRSVAVIGASRKPDTIGHQVLRNLLAGGFVGPVYPVNPGAPHVASVKAYPSVLDIPDDVDLAVVAVPSGAVTEVVRQCGEKGVVGLVVLSAGFGEVGTAGAEAQVALREQARRNGMRMVGPNCIGVANTAVGLNATFSPFAPTPGRIAMQSQSGALGIAILERSARIGIGVSSFVSVGNKADVSGNDLLQYWEDDPGTDVVLLYLESFGNPRKFSRVARRVSRRKPIVAVKSGRSAAGVRAASSHTAAMASPDVAVDALFRQAGVIRVDTLDELFDMAVVLSSQPLPAGRRVAIVGNSGGPGILATDACDGAGLTVPELTPATQAALRKVIDPNGAVGNPVDLVAGATPAAYEEALRLVLADGAVDAVIAINTATFAAPPAEVAAVLRRVAAGARKPLVGSFLAWPELSPLLRPAGPDEAAVPAFSSPEPAARALARAAAYSEWRHRPPGSIPVLAGFDRPRAQQVVDAFLAEHPDGGWLPPDRITELLGAIGVPVLETVTVASADEAAAEAARLGFPVALKAAGAQVVHKSDVGGVRLDLESAEEVVEAYGEMAVRVGPSMTGAVLQRMANPGVETIVGVVLDPLFGPLVMFGMGGVATELLRDRAFRILPLTDVDAAELVRSLRASPLLFGYRGAAPVDVAALEEVLERVARLAAVVDEVAELDLNPVIVSPAGVDIVDARVRVAPAGPAPDDHLRRLAG